MSTLRYLGGCLAVAILAAAPVLAQSVISAHSGVVHYTEGQVYLDDKAIEPKAGIFPEMKEKGVLRTADGRSEVLLTPGVFLRLAENSSVRMVTNRLVDTRLELLEGSALVEVAELLKDNSVSLVYRDASISLLKKGLYRLDTEPALLRVYAGEALAESGSQRVTLKEGKQLSLGGVWAVNKFDNKTGDAFYRWARRRAGYLAMANVYAAKSLTNSGRSWTSSGWLWNPYMAMFTFIPCRGLYYSPFGYSFYSPGVVYYRVYAPAQNGYWGGGGSNHSSYNAGYSTMPRTASGSSGAISSTPIQSAPASTSHATSGGSGDSGGRGGGRSR